MTSYGSDSYSYNSGNQRIKKTESGATTYYVSAGLDVLAEYDGSGNLAAEYIYGLDGKVSKFDSTQGHFWFVKDHLGSTRRLDSSSMLRDYYPYGQNKIAAGNEETAYQFTGKELDSGIGLHYFGARYYDPSIGRWLAPDPAGQGFSPYAYAGNSPLVMVDPNGEFFGLALALYSIYSAGKTAYSIYQAYQQGGWGSAFSALNQGIISWGAGQVVGSYATGAIGIGLGTSQGLWTATGGSAAHYGAGAFVGGSMAGLSGGDLWRQTGKSALLGGVIGFGSYKSSADYRYVTHQTVVGAAFQMGFRNSSFQYAAEYWGYDPTLYSYNGKYTDADAGRYRETGEVILGPKGARINGRVDGSKIMHIAWHETQHEMVLVPKTGEQLLLEHMRGVEEAIILNRAPLNKYFRLWSKGARNEIFAQINDYSYLYSWRNHYNY